MLCSLIMNLPWPVWRTGIRALHKTFHRVGFSRVREKFLLRPCRYSQVAGRINLIWHCWRLPTRMEQRARVPDEFKNCRRRSYMMMMPPGAVRPTRRLPGVEQVMLIRGGRCMTSCWRYQLACDGDHPGGPLTSCAGCHIMIIANG
jgi:hypothetical protein